MRLDTERRRFLDAPVVVGVVSRVVPNPGAPEWEQVLSAGAACQNLVIAANAMGFGVNWVTRWFAYSPGVKAHLGLADNERVLIATIDRTVIRKAADRAALFLRLSGPLQVPVTELERRYNSKMYDPLQPVPLKEGISEQTALFLRERSEDYPGVDVEEGWRREYPYAPIGAHVVGFMGAILERQLPYYKSLKYSPNERVGQYGVEQRPAVEARAVSVPIAACRVSGSSRA